MMPRICPHEEQEIREGVWIAAVNYHFHCRCPDRRTWNCDHYICLCPARHIRREQSKVTILVENRNMGD